MSDEPFGPTVPDAATEAVWKEGYDLQTAELVKVAAERDAALAAVERVRGVLSEWESRQERNREILGSGALGHFQAIDCTGDLRAALDGAPEPDTITIPRPVVPFGPVSKTENEATADYLLEVVKKIDGKYCAVGGSNVTATVRKLLVDAADAVRGLPVEGEKP